MTFADPRDVRLVSIVTPDWNSFLEFLDRADFAEVVVAAEVALGVSGDALQQQVALDFGCTRRPVEESASATTGARLDR